MNLPELAPSFPSKPVSKPEPPLPPPPLSDTEKLIHGLLKRTEELAARIEHLEKALQTGRDRSKDLPPITVPDIIDLVLQRENVRKSELRSQFRGGHIPRARQMICYLAKLNTLASLPVIARLLGYKDHTTVIHGIRKITELRQTDPVIDYKMENYELTLRLNASTKAEPRQEQVPAGPHGGTEVNKGN